jgi:hypothetical protein
MVRLPDCADACRMPAQSKTPFIARKRAFDRLRDPVQS